MISETVTENKVFFSCQIETCPTIGATLLGAQTHVNRTKHSVEVKTENVTVLEYMDPPETLLRACNMVRDYLASHPGSTGREMTDSLGLRYSDVIDARDYLVSLGEVTVEKNYTGQRGKPREESFLNASLTAQNDGEAA